MDIIKVNLNDLKVKYGIMKKNMCSDAEMEAFRQLVDANQPIPDDVAMQHIAGNKPYFYRYANDNVTDSEAMQNITLIQLEQLKSIKAMLIFFTVLAIITLLLLVYIFT